ncbi:MAG: tripartite tricarboxylate transporter substrate binding protein [Burkholderiales bacterium]
MRNVDGWKAWCAGAILLCAFSPALAADAYPSRPIRLIVPFSAGGGADIIARLLGSSMSKTLNTQFVIDTRPGAGTVLGTELAAHASPDGYTLVLVATAYATNPGLLGKLPFDPINAFEPITLAVDTPLIFVVPVSLPVSSLRELIDLAKSKPNGVIYGSSGQGTSGHLAVVLLSFKTGIRMTHVPYKGASQALIDLLGAQIQMLCTSTLPALPHVRSGQLRALAVTTATRSRAVPDVPTVAEAASLPGFRASSWYALLAPARTAPFIIGKLHDAATQALRSPAVFEQLLAQGADLIGNTPEELRQFLRNEIDTWTTVIKRANVRPGN